ncbi:MAG: DUF2442 domain-containing protein [Candidatus Nealsonbacteria bacterium]|nr:DUF2442 domain-containing protein [Candidatus Nealsonbacteria bacterium]
MIPKVELARSVRDFVIHLRFSGGTEGDIDLRDELYGEIFEPLKDQTLFRQCSVHPELHTIFRPNGADLAPEFLYDRVRILA